MSKVIPKESIDAARPWRAPAVEGSHVVGGRMVDDKNALPTAQQIEEIEQQAYEAGFQRGTSEGIEAGKQEIARCVASLDSVMQQLVNPLEALDETVEESLMALVLAVARQLIRRELRTDPGQIVSTVREALGALPVGQREVSLQLHPEDAALVREALGGDTEARWKIQEDPTLSRGDCRVHSETSRVDATVEHRLNAVAAAVLGGEREEDHDG